MEIHQLRYFCATARTGNFTRAAEQEHVAQPSLSQQIMKLEEELGARLFDRLGRCARLTQFGTAFLPRAQAILRELGEARCQIQEMAGVAAGRVVLGAIPTIAPYFLPRALTTFCRKYPDVQLNVVEEITVELLTQLRDGIIDLALLAYPVSGHDLIYDEILSEPLYIVVPESHRLATRRQLSLRDIEGDPFLLLKDGHCFRDTTISACHRAHFKPNIVFESGQFATLLGMVSSGMGVSVIPEMAIDRSLNCRFLLIDDPRARRRIGFVRLKHHFQTKAERAVVQHFKAMSAKSRNRPVAITAKAGSGPAS
ncbi:MAG TPA: LysR substrate-binding domain-containing protein [Terriglobales bacterium]|nr:LysR substrate-binding domain-containing protein [Terriglobales bacterium]